MVLQWSAPRPPDKVTGTVPVPKSANLGLDDLVASGRGGQFFVVAAAPGIQGQRLYRFRLTSTGQVTGFAPLPGGTLGNRNWTADAIAAAPDGSLESPSPCPGRDPCGWERARRARPVPHFSTRPSYIDIIEAGDRHAERVAGRDQQRVYGGQPVVDGARPPAGLPRSVVCTLPAGQRGVRVRRPHRTGPRTSTRPHGVAGWTAAPFC